MNLPRTTLEDIADTNFNIIVEIYKLLDFVDQLRFAQTSQWLKQIFRAYIWTPSYKTLKVDCVEDDFDFIDRTFSSELVATPTFFNVYEINGKRICLNQEEFTEFLALYANEVTELIACENYFPDIRNFKNITSLKSNTGANVEQHFKIVTENCPNLQSFDVIRNDLSILIKDSAERKLLKIDYLLQLKHLKILSLECQGYTMQYEEFCALIRNINLEYLRIKSYIEMNVPEVTHVETPEFLTELHICLSDSRLLAWNFNIFENLLRLNLSCEKTINANDWNTFSKAARRLEVLTMTFLKMPKTMEIINLPHTLKQVHIEHCKNLTGQHLTQIFNLPNLLKFSSKETFYKMRNSFKSKLPPQLQSLNCDRFNTFELLTSLESNQNLEELTWYNYKKNPLLNQDNRLLFCKSLKTLNVESGTLASDIILRMQNLCRLSLAYGTVFKWSDVIALIKHPVLEDLEIRTLPSDESAVRELEEGFPINLRVLSITSDELKLNLSFWLDILCKNLSRLKLIVHNVTKDVLKEIVAHKNFPKRTLSTITYGNLIVDCKTLQKKFHDTDDYRVMPFMLMGVTLILCNDKI